MPATGYDSPNLTAGLSQLLVATDSCSNKAIYIGRRLMRLQEFTIATTGDKAVVSSVLSHQMAAQRLEAETLVNRIPLNLKLH